MKELSIEEKAKAYDEALARANEMIKSMTNIGGVAKVDDIQHIFPELKESEDERISGNIIATIHLYYGEPLEDEAKEMIAWLEKQGEQKIKTPEESLGIDYDTYNKIVDECIYDEQKPAWIEEDEAMLAEISDLLWEGYKQSGSKFSWDDIRNWVIHKLKSLRHQKQWKPSDEQIDTLEYYMHNLICNEHKEVLFGLYADLKKLREE